jgi:hypothetical protein
LLPQHDTFPLNTAHVWKPPASRLSAAAAITGWAATTSPTAASSATTTPRTRPTRSRRCAAPSICARTGILPDPIHPVAPRHQRRNDSRKVPDTAHRARNGLRADLDGARRIADRIRATVRAANLHHIAAGLEVSISIGATALHPGMTAQDLFNAADANLYRAKRGGRDQVAA